MKRKQMENKKEKNQMTDYKKMMTILTRKTMMKLRQPTLMTMKQKMRMKLRKTKTLKWWNKSEGKKLKKLLMSLLSN